MPPISGLHQTVNAAAIQAIPIQPKCFPTSLAFFSYQHLSNGTKLAHPDGCGVIFDTRRNDLLQRANASHVEQS